MRAASIWWIASKLGRSEAATSGGPKPGLPDGERAGAYEYRAANAAYEHAKFITNRQKARAMTRVGISIDSGHRIGL